MFPKLQDNKIKHIQNIISGESKIKPYLNMTTKKPSRKQVIIPMNTENRNCFMKDSSAHISNINKVLKNIKSEIVTDFICVDGKGIIITTNKVANTSDLQTIERYIRNVNSIELNQVEALRLPQSKSYLKIIGISYFIKNTNIPISADVVEKIIKENHIFNDIILMLRLRAIKISPKSNMSIIWIDIQDVQNSFRAKGLINRCFNVGSYIATICRANMNLDIPQCKNCWKWGHITGSCRIQDSKYVKCNSPHKLEHHWQFRQYCKMNNKINPSQLKTKKEEPYPHTFKCVNCKSEHQVDLNMYLFWRHHFNINSI